MLAKRIISIILSCLLVLPSCFNLITVQAEETEIIYTFEDLLPLTEEEIGALSDKCKAGYAVGKKKYSDTCKLYEMDPGSVMLEIEILITIQDDTTYASTTLEGDKDFNYYRLCNNLKLPTTIMSYYDCSDISHLVERDWNRYSLSVFNEEYNGYSVEHVYCTIYTALANDPNIMKVNGVDDFLLRENEHETCDVDKDGVVTVADASAVLSVYAKIAADIICTEDELQNADANNDGTVTIADAIEILTVYAETAAGIA